jgi:hypothetical protein
MPFVLAQHCPQIAILDLRAYHTLLDECGRKKVEPFRLRSSL